MKDLTDTLIPLPEVADTFSINVETLRKIIRRECDEKLPDTVRMVPGGRVHDRTYMVLRDRFTLVMQGKDLTEPAPTVLSTSRSFLKTRDLRNVG